MAVHQPRFVVQAKQAIRKAFQYQVDEVCFSLVECLSICPTNWGLTPEDAGRWLEDMMIPYYPLGEHKMPEASQGGKTDAG